ncbi:amino acid adenylation domain-containing protein, partial [Pseudomonas sp. LRF_L74]|uniref:amino acid adenylation domain-containing protein n=1 Tax=Pseudomonas sp. LRF_L74 TaxID=3369422 RepID=UPI003F61572A
MQALIESVGTLTTKERKALAVLLKKKGINLFGITPIHRRGEDEPLLLSYAQQRQWFLWQLEPEGSAYHIVAALRLSGELKLGALEQSFEHLIQRHQGLRTTFLQDGDEVRQVVHEAPSIKLDIVELHESGASRDTAISAYIEEQATQSFDLETGPLFRVGLLRLSENEHVLALVQHHIVSDGWSMQIMVDELVRLYSGFTQNRQPDLPTLPIQYADYALWQRHWMDAGERERQLDYWLSKLGSDTVDLALPLDHPRPSRPSFRGASIDVPLTVDIGVELKRLAQREGVTLFVLLLAAFQCLLYRYTGQTDIRVGIPVANRSRLEIERLIGFFVNTQVLKGDLDGLLPFNEFLKQVRQTVLEAQEYQDLPFEQLVEALRPERSLSRNPLFQVMLNHQFASSDEASVHKLPGLKVSSVERAGGSEQFDLTLMVVESDDQIWISLSYAVDLFEPATIISMSSHLANLLRGILVNPGESISHLPLLGEAERELILSDCGIDRVNYPVDRCIHLLFEEQAQKTPDAVAVVFEDEMLTYNQLSRKANQLAHKLISLGVGPDVLVGIAVERSLDMVVGVLGILKAGGAYVPLDPEYPQDRLAYMIKDSGIELLLTQSHLTSLLPVPELMQTLELDTQVGLSVYAESVPRVNIQPENLAYVIYTSGSTGKPKGVAVAHGPFAMHARAVSDVYDLHPDDCLMQSASINFDAAAEQLFMPLLIGARIVLADIKRRSVHDVLESIRSNHVSAVNFPPAYLAYMNEILSKTGEKLDIRLCILGGEAWTLALLDGGVLQAEHIFNAYGPTEAVVTPLVWAADISDSFNGYAPIGKAVGLRRSLILDCDLCILVRGAQGELLLAGEGLARGYLNRPSLTAERFIPDPYDDSKEGGGRLYRTGDLAKCRADGVIEYVGRIDHQVKIRGFRIELGEIEACLLGQDIVRETVVFAQGGPAGQQLVGYVVPADLAVIDDQDGQAQLRDAIKTRLKESLPDYMVPSHLLFLSELPLTPNGKLDRKALPKPDASLLQQNYVAPQSELEQRIAAIWTDVLKLEQIGLTDNFFDLGGHSLLATQVISRVRQSLNLDVPLKAIFECSDLADFAQVAGESVSSKVLPFIQADRSQPLALSYAQQRQWFLWQLDPGSAAYNIPTALKLKGQLDKKALQYAFASLIQRHEPLRTTFRQEGEKAIQIIHAQIDFQLTVDESALASDKQLKAYVEYEVQQPFDLESGPLLRVKLLRQAEDEHVLILTLHHIVSDGWSMPLMVDELVQLYEGCCHGKDVQLPELAIQYADYAVWQRQWMEAGEQKRQLDYWTKQLGGEQPVLELPIDRPRPAEQSHAGASLDISLNAELSQGLKRLADDQGVTLFMVLLASFQVLLHRYSGQDDIRVGTPIANRTRLETERLIGFFVNTQVLKAEFDVRVRFTDLLQQVKQVALGAQDHQDLPFEQLVEALQPERSLSHSPLFQVMYNHQTEGRKEVRSLAGLEVQGLEWENNVAQFDLTLNTLDSTEGIYASLTYACELFERTSIEQIAQHWVNLLAAIVARPTQMVSDLPMLAIDEQQTILKEWNHTESAYPSNRFVHQLIAERAEQVPEAVAVLFGDSQLTYGELDRQANQLAHKLIELGVGPEIRVAVAMPRSAEIMVAFLGVLKAGGAYVPLDLAYPKDRLSYMMQDSQAPLLLTNSQQREGLPSVENMAVLEIDNRDDWNSYPCDAPQIYLHEENLAYVIYTSGSTGLPKGVAVSHGPLAAHIIATGERYETCASDCELHFMSFAFDGAHEGWMHPLINGARILVRDDSLWTPEQTLEQMHRHAVTIGVFPPIYLQQLAEHAQATGHPPIARVYCFGGDAVPEASYELVWKALKPTYIFNGYGPTETVVTPLIWKARFGDRCDAAYAPIGKLVGKRCGYVMDAQLTLLPYGVPGELYLGGQGVARGYLERPALTAERFVPDAYAEGGRLYRSGDLVRCREGDVVDYLGRVDHQVKVRGFRIELGEVEARLLDQELLLEAVVTAQDGVYGKQLVAYIIPTDVTVVGDQEAQFLLRESIKTQLRESLPDYMVPAHLLFLEKLPLTPNGKLDRKALPKPDASLLQQGYVAPQSELEQRIAAIWADVLKLEKVG